MIHVLRVDGPAWVQDGGRVGQVWQGLPEGGWLVPELAISANRAAGNAGETPAIEHFGPLVVAARGTRLRIAYGGEARDLDEDHVCVVPAPPGRVGYLAVRGGFQVQVIAGGRGCLPSAGIGRVLRSGDRLGVGVHKTGAAKLPGFVWERVVRVVAGPDSERFATDALERLLDQGWKVGVADRVGMRLEGGSVPRRDGDAALSAPMVAGAVQVPADGAPIVLGPDHPTTGGYPVIAVVIRADRGALFARLRGDPVRFVAVSLEEGRAATASWRKAWNAIAPRESTG